MTSKTLLRGWFIAYAICLIAMTANVVAIMWFDGGAINVVALAASLLAGATCLMWIKELKRR